MQGCIGRRQAPIHCRHGGRTGLIHQRSAREVDADRSGGGRAFGRCRQAAAGRCGTAAGGGTGVTGRRGSRHGSRGDPGQDRDDVERVGWPSSETARHHRGCGRHFASPRHRERGPDRGDRSPITGINRRRRARRPGRASCPGRCCCGDVDGAAGPAASTHPPHPAGARPVPAGQAHRPRTAPTHPNSPDTETHATIAIHPTRTAPAVRATGTPRTRTDKPTTTSPTPGQRARSRHRGAGPRWGTKRGSDAGLRASTASPALADTARSDTTRFTAADRPNDEERGERSMGHHQR